MPNKLKPHQSLETSGARGVEPFELDGRVFLAIPQLSEDIQGDPPNMNGGNSDLDAIIYRWEDGRFAEYQRIPTHGGEAASFFSIGERKFLALASIRSGRHPNYSYNLYSTVYEWDGKRFFPLQDFPTFAAKGCHGFQIGDGTFLSFSEGVSVPDQDPSVDTSARLYKWNGNRFDLFQSLPSKWGYDIHDFTIGDTPYLGLADHAQQSILYRWDGTLFREFQSFDSDGGGRCFESIDIQGETYLAIANLLSDSTIYKFSGEKFVEVQRLAGPAGRSFSSFRRADDTYLMRTNFISGSRQSPITTQDSVLYRWSGQAFEVVETYATCGGTQSKAFHVDEKTYIAVANSLTAEARFRTDTVIYAFL